jgi:phosphotransferase system enzyme I (PtsI)
MLIGVPAMTRTNKRVYVHANIGGLKDLEEVKKYKPDGVGLLRTEFLYMDSPYFPTEGDQFNAYKVIAETLGKEKPVIIRTLDIGADKKLTYFEMPNEENPALGLRAIRLSMANKNMFKTQLRAILRASYYGNVKIMYPMISGVEEINEAEIVLKEAKQELKEEGLPFNENIEVGIMIEVPSAAIIADILVDKADFFSIGTNDLTQYVLAADRLSKEVAHIYNNYHPAVMRMVNFVAEAAVRAGKKVSICGEMGGDTLALLAFISFGIYDLSMLPQLIPKIKKIVQNIEHDSLKGLKEKILSSKTAEEVKETLNDYLLGVM